MHRGPGDPTSGASSLCPFPVRSGTPARHQVEMQVIDDLSSLGSGIAREAVPTLAVACLLGQDPGHANTAPYHRLVGGLEPRDRFDVALRDDEQMHGRLGVEILTRQDEIILIYDVCGALTEDDAAEYACGGHRSPPVVYNPVVDRRPLRSLNEGERDGNLSEVQAQDPEERQPRQARLGLVSQDVPGESGACRKVEHWVNDGAPEDAGAPIGSNGGGEGIQNPLPSES